MEKSGTTRTHGAQKRGAKIEAPVSGFASQKRFGAKKLTDGNNEENEENTSVILVMLISIGVDFVYYKSVFFRSSLFFHI